MPASASSADPGDDARLVELGSELAEAIEADLPSWVVRQVEAVAQAWQPGLEVELHERAVDAGRQAVAEIGPRVRELVGTDADRQSGTPLALVREAVRYPTRVLADAGVGEVVRDEFVADAFPDDVYALAPASLRELSGRAHEAGLVWGAAKAHVILARRRSEGLR